MRHYHPRTIMPGLLILVLAFLLTLPGSASARHHGEGHCAKHERSYEFRTINWNPPFAEKRLQATMAEIDKAGAEGFKMAHTLPDGTGGLVLVMQRKVVTCQQ